MEMQQHIDSGCKKCAATLQVWQNVVALAAEESAFTPPADVIRIVKSQLAPRAFDVSAGVRLLFDSNLHPVTAGIRGSIAATQFLYETDDYFIDLRLEPRREGDRACLVGQILKRAGKERTTQGVTVRLQERQLPIARTSTNQLGEFQFEFAATTQVCLAISQDSGHDIILPLYGVAQESKEGKDLD
jgi:hypothetical protein